MGWKNIGGFDQVNGGETKFNGGKQVTVEEQKAESKNKGGFAQFNGGPIRNNGGETKFNGCKPETVEK
ncbi:hypothetical protein [Ectobacillus sp. sgz5001026]|uniref:hypothetical protein n=1 Tax=Ectobacillus sp. sgz5001026 TaxID=3242473 RepID=UPI0036D39E32